MVFGFLRNSGSLPNIGLLSFGGSLSDYGLLLFPGSLVITGFLVVHGSLRYGGLLWYVGYLSTIFQGSIIESCPSLSIAYGLVGGNPSAVRQTRNRHPWKTLIIFR